MKILLEIFFVILLFTLSKTTYGQTQPDSAKLYRVETIEGNKYLGLLTTEDSLWSTTFEKIVAVPRLSFKVPFGK